MATRWHDLDWKTIKSRVRKLRRRIYAAASKGDKRKLQNLQKLMVSSNLNLLSAIRRVTATSQGKVTPGPDRQR